MFLDDAGLGLAAARALLGAGHRVVTVRAGDAFGRDGEGGYVLAPERGREGYDLLLRDLVARGHAPGRIAHFWLVTRAETYRPGSSFFHRNIEQGFYSLMFLAQALAEENLPRPIHINAFTTGAAQIRAEPLAYPEKATLAGPARVMPRELPGVTCATLDLDLPVKLPEALVAQVLEELLSPTANTAAALRGARRYERGVKAVALPDAEGFTLPQGAPVLITGGFGGIGLTLAEDLIRRFGARILLIARRPLPERKVWDAHLATNGPDHPVSRRILALRRLNALGGEVIVAEADVCNVEDMRAALAMGEAAFGPIRAVIHAAGVVDDGPILAKSPAAVEEVFAPKLHGSKVLDSLFPDGRLDWLVLFSSTSTFTGPSGQVDYVAANEYLNAFAAARSGGKTRVVALNWGIWAGVGMAAETLAERMGTRPPAPRLPVTRPLLHEASFDADGHRRFTATLSAEDWVIGQHRTKGGTALLPGTGYLELAAEALAEEGIAAFEARDLTFFRPLDVPDGTKRDLRVSLRRSDEGYAFEVRSAVNHRGRTGWQINAQGRLIPRAPEAPQIDPAAIAARLAPAETGQGLPSPQEAHLAFGPRWRVIHSRAFGPGEGLARLTLPEAFRTEAGPFILHPALMDLATGWAMGLIAGYQPSHLWVPVAYAGLRLHAPLPADVISWVRNASANRADGPVATFDITLADPQGRVCIEIEGFTIRRLDAGFALSPPDARDLAFDDTGSKALSPAEQRLAANLAQGIRPEEGAEAFARALATGLSQVVVSSLDLPALIRQSAEVEAARPEGAAFARPDLDSAYVEPRNDVERTLTGFWQELLGVAQVGVEDDFFALGGHSLIAVRLFAMVRKAYRVDFPISILFEAPTIAACAAMIEERIGPATEAPTVPQRRFTHLVAMHEREGGPRRPFFLVAGMFGNVLNLRHLAQLLGGDRPFYGLQARGLYGDQPPHTTLPAAAADYIAEMRQAQPHGPYLIGGFSGGGLTAWEMARQLEAAGEDVSLLALLDTPLPMRPALSRADKAAIKLAEFRRKGAGYALEWWQARQAWKAAQAAGPAAQADHAFHNAAIEAAFRAAISDYDMPVRQGRTVLFRPPLDLHWQVTGGRWVSRAKEYVFPDNDLTRFAPALEVIEVPGDHDGMVLEPNVRVLAARMRAVIAEAEAESPAPLQRAAE